MTNTQWNQMEKKVYLCLYGIVVGGLTILAISHLIEACRSRPKVLALYIGVKDNPEKSESASSSAEK